MKLSPVTGSTAISKDCSIPAEFEASAHAQEKVWPMAELWETRRVSNMNRLRITNGRVRLTFFIKIKRVVSAMVGYFRRDIVIIWTLQAEFRHNIQRIF